MLADPVTNSTVQAKLEATRKDLLDLGLRNSLLNYRTLKSRGVDVVDELPAEIFRIIVRQGKSMSFLPAADDAVSQETALLAQPEEPEPSGKLAARHTDSRLQTAASSPQLQTRLLNTYHAARSFIEEQGVNTLFLALGMLHWYEADSSQQLLKAPLILLPVALERTDAQSRFFVRYSGDDLGDNLSLAAKLKTDFGMTLPQLPELEELDAGSYFDQVQQAIRSQPRWSVDRGAVALAFFSFSKFLMFKDLDTTTWPTDDQPINHPLILALLDRGFHEPPSSIPDDDHLDQYVQPEKLNEVIDADSSQTIAILDVNNGRNLVIQGPPGTGKSQTITNIIAETIGQGRTVLFVSEKMAALDVVKRRLDALGLGDACLELHSNKAQKKAVLAELKRTLDLGQPRNGQTPEDFEAFRSARDRLNAYSYDLNTAIGAGNLTPFQVYGRLLRHGRLYPENALQRIKDPTMSN